MFVTTIDTLRARFDAATAAHDAAAAAFWAADDAFRALAWWAEDYDEAKVRRDAASDALAEAREALWPEPEWD